MDLSIVILNYNTSELTLNCIDSILKYTENINYEVFVVDNASKKEDFINLKNKLPNNINLIRTLQNGGFSSGNNKAVDFIKGKYTCFVNSDIILLENTFKIMFDFMEQNKNTAVCSGVQLDENQKHKKFNFGHYHNWNREILGDKLLEILLKKPNRKQSYEKHINVDFISGCLMFFNTEAYKKVGGFDNNIFLYYEEMDICKRLQKIGLNSVHIPYTKYIHLEGSSTKIGYQKKIELIVSLLYILHKNDGYISFFIMKNLLILKYFFKMIFKPKHYKLFFKLIFLGNPLVHSLKNKQKII